MDPGPGEAPGEVPQDIKPESEAPATHLAYVVLGEDGRVAEGGVRKVGSPFPTGAILMSVGDYDVRLRQRIEGGEWKDRDPEPQESAEVWARRDLDEAKSNAETALIAWLDARASDMTGKVPIPEMLSWGSKEAAARSVLDGTASGPTILDAEAGVTGEPLALLAANVVASADAYRQAAGLLAGTRRVGLKAILAATTPDEALSAASEAMAACVAAL